VGARYGTALVGGDTVAAACATISVTVVGETAPAPPNAAPPLLRRDAGRVGDAVAVTGTLGASAGGLRLLEADASGAPIAVDPALADALRTAHRRPTPRVAEAALLVTHGIRCAMDVSDGLLGDAGHIAELSGVGVVLEAARVPIAPALAAAFPAAALALALGGGEDYELLCAAPAEALAAAAAALKARGGPPLTVVGRLVAAPSDGPRVRVVDAAGAPLMLEGGYVHFTS
jgi:thiamine-monophosphate kinase